MKKTTPPPNNIEQLIAWIRLFAQDIQNRLSALENLKAPQKKENKQK